MTDQPSSQIDLLKRRLSGVAAISALNMEALKLAQTLGAIEMDLLRLELELGRSGPSAQLVQDLHEAKTNAEAIGLAQAECEERIAVAEREVEEIDRLIAAPDGN